ncbi:tetratricopeptide repeat (TPR)-like superfamily protein [Actinidia rufa]|uniref:Tetratricopeptide repeat (TPR)-like superfamily protein n=1 Tax=Actinidia rufa TaxID=165716 RepID=A0A7J0DFF9_9ERIC|nr:tetratricopeptide repeat (TPR)-like superfamily protein [Actinidia rufa]
MLSPESSSDASSTSVIALRKVGWSLSCSSWSLRVAWRLICSNLSTLWVEFSSASCGSPSDGVRPPTNPCFDPHKWFPPKPPIGCVPLEHPDPGLRRSGSLSRSHSALQGYASNWVVARIASSLVTMYSQSGETLNSELVFGAMILRNIVSWTAMIAGYVQNGFFRKGLRLFREMVALGTQPNAVTLVSILPGLCWHAGLVDEGRKYFKSMTEDYLITPGLEHCACLVDLLGRAGQLMEAYEFIENMPSEPDGGVWGALLGACRIHGNLDLAELVAERLYQLEPETVSFYVLMANIYAEAGRWDDVAKLRKLMEERKLKKIPGQSFGQYKSGDFIHFCQVRYLSLPNGDIQVHHIHLEHNSLKHY